MHLNHQFNPENVISDYQHPADDEQYQRLLEKITSDTFAAAMTLEEPSIKEFYNVRERLSIVNGMIMYSFEDGEKRTVVPKSLRQQILKNLHAANQGSTSMLARVRKTVY